MDFARNLTARPWAIGPADIRRLSDVGLSRTSTVLVIGLVAMFNYLTRVADGTGVEADYQNALPEFVYRGRTAAVDRPGPDEWPPVDGSIESLSVLLPDAQATWQRWRDYVLESPDPISRSTRRRLRWIAARNACDSTVPEAEPVDGALAGFADQLSRTPWLTSQSDVDALRSIGLDDRAILHVIAVVAYQSAESRLRIGLSALARAGN